eukprot:271778_1
MAQKQEQKTDVSKSPQQKPDNVYEIFPYLYLSSFGATKQYKELQAMKLTNIINVTNNTGDHPTEQQYKLFDVLFLPLRDEDSYDILTAIKTLALYIDSLTQNNKNQRYYCIVR